jgi:UDP-N-acetyl-D-mannosaminuronic acid transferase (WecB/TagA/CpsF family)
LRIALPLLTVAAVHDNATDFVDGLMARDVGAFGTLPTVTTFTALDTAPVPNELIAATRNQYFVPAARPVVTLKVRMLETDLVMVVKVVPLLETWIW